jgi:hypothetical protein
MGGCGGEAAVLVLVLVLMGCMRAGGRVSEMGIRFENVRFPTTDWVDVESGGCEVNADPGRGMTIGRAGLCLDSAEL